MNRFNKTLAITSIALATAFSMSTASAAGKADLVPFAKALGSGKVSVKNIGKAESRATWLTIKCLAATGCPEHPSMNSYENPKFPNAVTVKVPALKAGASFSHQLTFWNKLKFKPGQYKFMVLADAGHDIPESNELNNKAYYLKNVSKPIDSFTSKGLTTKQPIKAKSVKATAHTLPTHPGANTIQNGPGKADLIIRPYYQNAALPEGFPGQSFCEQALTGGTPKNIWFFVTNQGNAMTTASELKVFFNTFTGSGASGIYNRKIGALAKGQSKAVKVALPKGCYPGNFSSSCHFRIVTDSAYHVQESNESNNHVDSKCVSPAG